MRAVAYLCAVAGTTTLFAIGTVLLTIAVDPYRVFGTPVVKGWTELKPRAYQQAGMAKTYQLERVAPMALVLGNSRTEIGLDPEAPEWPAGQRPVFNAAIAGGNVYTSLLMLREDLALRRPNLIVIGLDFQDFLAEINEPSVPYESEGRLLVDVAGRTNAARPHQIWRDRLMATLSINAVADSVLTSLDQNPMTSATMTPLGFNPLHEYRVFVARSGYKSLFVQKMAIYRKQYASYKKPDLARPWQIAAYRHLRNILQIGLSSQIPIVLYIHPYHADFLLMLEELALWPSFEDWKRVVVNAVEETVANTPGDVRIVDFSGFNEYTTEAVPSDSDKSVQMLWYWEPGHYKSTLGDRILAMMFHDDQGFGRALTASNIELVLSAIRAERTQFGSQSAATKRPNRASR